MKIHDEMSQISVPEDLDEKTYQSILSAEKTVQKNRFRKKCAWSVLSCLVIIFGIIHVVYSFFSAFQKKIRGLSIDDFYM